MILTRYKFFPFTSRLIALAVIPLALTGCGGSSGGSSDDTSTESPVSNSAPVANAGADQNITTGDSVNLSGNQSSDADGDSLSYSWSFSSLPDGSSADLSSNSSSSTSFTADLSGSYILSLVVDDGTVSSSADSVTVIAIAADNNDSDSPSYSRGVGTTTTSNLFASGTRVAPLGTVTDDDDISWSVPADVRYSDSSMPFASDLYNVYQSGHDYSSASQALAALTSGDGSDIIEIDSDGELITAYIFADNYFELYINGTAVA